MDTTFLVPKSIWKSKTFWFSLIGIIIILVLLSLEAVFLVDVPTFIMPLVAVFISIFIGSEKVKDGKEMTAKILVDIQPADILKLTKPIVNESPAKYMTLAGILLNGLYGVMISEGAEISPVYIGAIDTILATFIGFDKYKAAKINIASALVKKKEIKDP